MNIAMSNRKGFTLPELMVSAAVIVPILAALFTVFAMGRRSMMDTSGWLIGQSQARYSLEHMTKTIMPAEEFSVSNAGNRLDFNAPGEDPSRYEFLSTQNIVAGRNVFRLVFTSPSESTLTIADNIARDGQEQFFAAEDVNGKESVRIRFELVQESSGGDPLSVLIDTSLLPRNISGNLAGENGCCDAAFWHEWLKPPYDPYNWTGEQWAAYNEWYIKALNCPNCSSQGVCSYELCLAGCYFDRY